MRLYILIFAFAASAMASAQQQMTPQVVPSTLPPSAAGAPTGTSKPAAPPAANQQGQGTATQQTPGAGQQTPVPTPPIPQVAMPQAPPSQANNWNMPLGSLQEAMQGMQYKQGGDDIPAPNANGDIEYGNTHRFRYGGVGAGNIGTGLCTTANANRTQVTSGFCKMLEKELNTEGTCANEKLKLITSRGRLGQSEHFCRGYDSKSMDYKKLVIQRILEGLIVQESGWRPDAQEPNWFKNGNPMGGKGLFQFGVRDRVKPGCGHINSSNILTPEANIKCGSCIALTFMAKDQTIGHGVGDRGTVGLARYFGPFRNGQSHKRDAIANSVRQWCASNDGASTGGSVGSPDPNNTKTIKN